MWRTGDWPALLAIYARGCLLAGVFLLIAGLAILSLVLLVKA
jgi:hypothetical protein